MHLNFGALLAGLGRDFAFRIANAARAPGDYLFATLLPEEQRFTYHVESGTMTIRATMAGLVGMDSPYPPGGVIDSSKFEEQTLKIANEIPLTEQALRTLQDMMLRLSIGGSSPTNDVITRNLLNFVQKVIVQPHLDTAEWLRGQALVTGKVQWTFGGITIDVDYGVPGGGVHDGAANFLTHRTGNDGYGGTTSKFWTDWRAAKRILKSVRAVIAHSTTIDEIRYNEENQLVTLSEDGAGVRLRKVTEVGGADFTRDAGDVVNLIAYDREAEVLDPANPAVPKKIPFMPVGKLLFVGNNTIEGFSVGVDEGSTEDPNRNNRLGYTHIAPTVEGDGRPGRWANVFSPEHEPYKIIGRGASNLLPVIEAPTKVVVASTVIA